MSLILDALRKIELERRAKRLKSPVLRSDVLHFSGAAPNAGKSRKIPITAAVVLLLSAAVALFLFFSKTGPTARDTAPQRNVVTRESTPLIPSPPLPAPPVPEPAQKSTPPEIKTAGPPVKQSADSVTATQIISDPGITVTGIAWQDERSLRRAVINGHLVGEGTEVAGAKIIEIKESRVRFSRNGEIFEIMHASRTEGP